jgi:hypothetical protein
MVDLETRGDVAGCGIISVGAVAFQPHGEVLHDEFYAVVNQASNDRHYLFDTPGTMAWWSKQSEEARKALVINESNAGEDISDVLRNFSNFCTLNNGHPAKDVRVWGNGADFDDAILGSAWAAVYPTVKYEFPFGGRCYRTIKNLGELFGGPELPKLVRQGEHHNALDDAKSQAAHFIAIMAHIAQTW